MPRPALDNRCTTAALETRLELWHIGAVNADELKQLLRTSVFRPFTLHSPDKAFLISHPESAALSPGGDTLIIFHKDDGGFEILDVPLISRVEVHGMSPPRSGS